MKTLVDRADITKLREAVAYILEGVPAEFNSILSNIELVLEELIVNVCHYAYNDKVRGQFKLSRRTVTFDGDPYLVITLKDWGKPFNPFVNKEEPNFSLTLEDRKVGGLGLHLIRNFVDHYCYYYYRKTNVTEIFFKQKS
ncbi:MAG: ATP-binding protein [Deltaproteobacteria bacterium]|jgi:anti-sigma regulatory factor (Ser/Thr protein kinase)|nr:ATP-binding protein [Deltaproteobacteria bacterium]